MITVCTGGWSKHLQHSTVVLRDDGNDDKQTSHGVCSRCAMMLDAELKGVTGQALEQYATYLKEEHIDTGRD